ncbi:hypothetical protein O181_015672 [Austropuccinia psidii MF-1]|uniref:SMODS and SLOG-associating 2TM effector domain-containing protein n=1 Tax=Austropuccinia psidii MF-1 TaxID=1389203 RepID=A0A9Q3C2J3_9BASI|nr:hypothetical protein [Austropuccinia psidii MF-1]
MTLPIRKQRRAVGSFTLIGQRRRKSSGKCKAAFKEVVRQSTASLLFQASNSDSSVDDGLPGLDPRPSHVASSMPIPSDSPSNPECSKGPNLGTADPTSEFAKLHKPHKPSANVTCGQGRRHTVSIALPGSIVNNAQTWELKTALVGQIARACAIFSVDEIVIFEETLPEAESTNTTGSTVYGRGKYRPTIDILNDGAEDESFDPCHFVARILEYLECPQYLRKSLFPLHPDLRLAGLLPPLDLPHHFRREHNTPWREGCILPLDKVQNYLIGDHRQKRRAMQGKKTDYKTVWADVGLEEPVEVTLEEGISVPEWTRVTVQMPTHKTKTARLVSPRLPAEDSGVYWGYSVRLATSISKVFTETPYRHDGGYDLTIGTSERGQNVDDVIDQIGDFKHLLLALGGLSGLELCIAADSALQPRLTAEDASLLFDYWLNTLPCQGSRTIRTEEALLLDTWMTTPISRSPESFNNRTLNSVEVQSVADSRTSFEDSNLLNHDVASERPHWPRNRELGWLMPYGLKYPPPVLPKSLRGLQADLDSAWMELERQHVRANRINLLTSILALIITSSGGVTAAMANSTRGRLWATTLGTLTTVAGTVMGGIRAMGQPRRAEDRVRRLERIVDHIGRLYYSADENERNDHTIEETWKMIDDEETQTEREERRAGHFAYRNPTESSLLSGSRKSTIDSTNLGEQSNQTARNVDKLLGSQCPSRLRI